MPPTEHGHSTPNDKISRWIDTANPADLPSVDRRHGVWHPGDIEWLTSQVREVAGDFAEIGVFQGAAFKKLAPLAAAQGRTAHAFDSFVGMDEPTANDGPQYPKGKFDIGGHGQFTRLMTEAGVPEAHYRLWPGYIPDCFATVPARQAFSLVILDVDHYQPTLQALEWLRSRIALGGLLALDDFVPSLERHASKAIREFFSVGRPFERIAFFNQHLILRRTHGLT